tara:strand:- start:283 stop:540 length:258 start_codon:yes stop_codon:yes gene_type:complete
MELDFGKYTYEIIVVMSLLLLYCLKKQRDFKDSNFILYIGIILGVYYYMKKKKNNVATYASAMIPNGVNMVVPPRSGELPPFPKS